MFPSKYIIIDQSCGHVLADSDDKEEIIQFLDYLQKDSPETADDLFIYEFSRLE